MRTIQLVVICVTAWAATAGQGQAELITTLFSSNTGGFNGGNVYFDLNILSPTGIRIERIATNTSETFTAGRMNIYTRPGTYVGSTGSTAGWTLASSGFGNSAGLYQPSMFDVTDFILGPGVTGIAIESQSGVWGHAYTIGTGTNQFYSNGDLSISLGAATQTPFTGTLFAPRVWNGTLQYSEVSAVPEPSSLAVLGVGLSIAGLATTRHRWRARKQVP
ncbi:PEP-CTERM sorting domain-containing protein [Allorhodopirellula heiligendammensis]|uniref:Uncharacterized protein n=1 Tax=Allorhodopirellula heiligendammensis TaxID=2714739 RepID=A0A5C6BVN8_9BACT|nr:PEP-CTERM sorting domain-containing protein [Allorhodopirellula heiligendammensis]TWU16350.1 hypothetical protein Poly21_35550 [Allorhodopirellula heiligendammensis]